MRNEVIQLLLQAWHDSRLPLLRNAPQNSLVYLQLLLVCTRPGLQQQLLLLLLLQVQAWHSSRARLLQNTTPLST
jgi:hypothetical protein